VFLGLDNAGKSTLLHLLKTGTLTIAQPTGNAQHEEFQIGGVTISAHDVGGHKAARRIWSQYFAELNGIVFLVDSADPERLAECRHELDSLLNTKELEKVPILILGNKIDKQGAVPEHLLKQQLGLDGPNYTACTGKKNFKLGENQRALEVFMCSVAKKSGYADGFQWLTQFF